MAGGAGVTERVRGDMEEVRSLTVIEHPYAMPYATIDCPQLLLHHACAKNRSWLFSVGAGWAVCERQRERGRERVWPHQFLFS